MAILIERHENVSENVDGPVGTTIETFLEDSGETSRVVTKPKKDHAQAPEPESIPAPTSPPKKA